MTSCLFAHSVPAHVRPCWSVAVSRTLANPLWLGEGFFWPGGSAPRASSAAADAVNASTGAVGRSGGSGSGSEHFGALQRSSSGRMSYMSEGADTVTDADTFTEDDALWSSVPSDDGGSGVGAAPAGGAAAGAEAVPWRVASILRAAASSGDVNTVAAVVSNLVQHLGAAVVGGA